MLAGHAATPTSADLSSDPSLRVTFKKVWKPEGLVVVLYLGNKLARPLPGVQTQLDVQGARLIPSIGFGDGSANSLLQNSLAPHGSARHVLTLTTAQPAAGMSLRGQASFVDGAPRAVYFTVPLAAADFVRARTATVAEFGSMWEKFTAERKQRIAPAAITTMEELQQRAEGELHLRPVEVIGKELICMGQVLQDPSLVCMLHVMLVNKGLEATVRSPSAPTSEFIMRQCAALWKA